MTVTDSYMSMFNQIVSRSLLPLCMIWLRLFGAPSTRTLTALPDWPRIVISLPREPPTSSTWTEALFCNASARLEACASTRSSLVMVVAPWASLTRALSVVWSSVCPSTSNVSSSLSACRAPEASATANATKVGFIRIESPCVKKCKDQ